ncbi:hypothetical protein BpHYR1_043395 [Brachionus plicatilis]|uniref:Secreted protein n=1 Tax=Brachionus plicatilis TaxID=10195 RepID=A0A3M7RKQ7_BRAPC|nr:hypothetical protein BpHYR1_043395 [Brachionus plicatilis]
MHQITLSVMLAGFSVLRLLFKNLSQALFCEFEDLFLQLRPTECPGRYERMTIYGEIRGLFPYFLFAMSSQSIVRSYGQRSSCHSSSAVPIHKAFMRDSLEFLLA